MNMFEAVIRSDRGRWVWSIEATDSGRTVEDSAESYATVEAICTPVKAALARWNAQSPDESGIEAQRCLADATTMSKRYSDWTAGAE